MRIKKKVDDLEEQLPLYQRRDFPELKLRIAYAVRKYRETPAICKGPQAEHQVIAKLLEECGLLVIGGPPGHVDILGFKVVGKHMEFPLKAVGVEVENFSLASNSVHITASKLRERSGPFFVIVVETNLGEYSYLVYTYREMKRFVQNVKIYDGSYQFSVPRKTLKEDKHYKSYYEKWEKITEAVYGLGSAP